MTTTAPKLPATPNGPFERLLTSFAAKTKTLATRFESVASTGEAVEPPAIEWLQHTATALIHLPWHETDLPDGRVPPEPEAAAALLWLMLNALDDTTIKPTAILPTSRGGVAAEWHVDNFHLEIECNPDGTAGYNFAGPGIEEYEGPITSDLTRLRAYLNNVAALRATRVQAK